MKLLRSLLLMLCAGLAVASVRATTVIPPTFDQLVSDAELIFEGTVTGSRSQWTGEGAERNIVTYVTFNVEDAIKGAPGKSYTIRMLGGTIDGETAEVADAPRFKTGDRDILFVEHNGSQFVPLVGIMHGRFHVQKDAGGATSLPKTMVRHSRTWPSWARTKEPPFPARHSQRPISNQPFGGNCPSQENRQRRIPSKASQSPKSKSKREC